MKIKLTPELCYMAGLFSKSSHKSKNFVSISTTKEELKERFVEIAIKNLMVEPTKIIVGSDEDKSIGFYHSRIAKQLQNVVSRETFIFKKINNFSKSYVAGMFDISGHIRLGNIEISHIKLDDAFMLENLGVHTKGDAVLNTQKFIDLIRDSSIIIKYLNKQMHSPNR